MAESIFEKFRLSICQKLIRLSICKLSICWLSICRLSICMLSIICPVIRDHSKLPLQPAPVQEPQGYPGLLLPLQPQVGYSPNHSLFHVMFILPSLQIKSFPFPYIPFQTLFSCVTHSKFCSPLWYFPNCLLLYGHCRLCSPLWPIPNFLLLDGPFSTFFFFMAHSKLSSPFWPIPNFLLLDGPFSTFLFFTVWPIPNFILLSVQFQTFFSFMALNCPFQTFFFFLAHSRLSSL